jgi:hypothetical protein
MPQEPAPLHSQKAEDVPPGRGCPLLALILLIGMIALIWWWFRS